MHDTLETKWASLPPAGQKFFVHRYEYCKMLWKKKVAALKAKEVERKPQPTAKEKRCAADTLAEAKRRERGEILLKLGAEFGDARVEELIARLDINWYTASDKWVRIVRLYLANGMDRVDGESQRRWGARPRYLELQQLAELEGVFNGAVQPVS